MTLKNQPITHSHQVVELELEPSFVLFLPKALYTNVQSPSTLLEKHMTTQHGVINTISKSFLSFLLFFSKLFLDPAFPKIYPRQHQQYKKTCEIQVLDLRKLRKLSCIGLFKRLTPNISITKTLRNLAIRFKYRMRQFLINFLNISKMWKI